MSTKPVMPFPTETDPVLAPVDPVQQSAIDARAAYKQSVAAARSRYESDAVAAWERSELQRREKFISAWKEDHLWNSEKPRYKYPDWDDESIFRDRCEPAVRLERLLEAKLYGQYLKCLLVRAGGSTSIAQVKSWLAPHIPVDGEHVIKPNDAELANLMRKGRSATTTYTENLSAELYQILTNSYMLRVGLGGRVEFDWRAVHNDRSSW
jgi:hypothetical protein